jgi:hypothetical protein
MELTQRLNVMLSEAEASILNAILDSSLCSE